LPKLYTGVQFGGLGGKLFCNSFTHGLAEEQHIVCTRSYYVRSTFGARENDAMGRINFNRASYLRLQLPELITF
jgi:hypothetical protein